MIRVLFDGTEIHGNYIQNLSQSVQPYNQNFIVGNTICRQFDIDVNDDGYADVPAIVHLYEDNDSNNQEDWTKYATLLVDSSEMQDGNYTTFHLTDVMVRLNRDLTYTAGDTVLKILQDICALHQIELVTTSFYMSDFQISWQDNLTERNMVSYVAEVNGGYAYINADGDLAIEPYGLNPVDNIDINQCSSFKIGDHHYIDRVYLELATATQYYPASTSLDTLYLNPANILFNDAQGYTIQGIIRHIYDIVHGLSFYNVEIEQCPINPDVRAGQMISISGDWSSVTTSGNDYITTASGDKILLTKGFAVSTIVSIDWHYNSQWIGGYKTDLQCKVQEETKIVTSNELITRINIKVDREIGAITQEVSDLEETTTASLALKVDKTDNDQIISMINASADNIVLNTKSLIFGIYPNGQYIEVKNYYSGSNAIGVTFDGTGSIFMRPQGQFIINNLVNSTSTTTYNNRFVMDKNGSDSSNTAYLVNYDNDNNLLVNLLQFYAHRLPADGVKHNFVDFRNYASDTGTRTQANFFQMYGRSDRKYIDVNNYYPSSSQAQNRLILDSNITSGSDYVNRAQLNNYKAGVSQFANRVYMNVPTTASTSSSVLLQLMNYNQNANSIGNSLMLASYTDKNVVEIYNRKINTSTTGNDIKCTASGTFNQISILNNKLSATTKANEIVLGANSSKNTLDIINYDSGGNVTNYLKMSTNDLLYLWSRSDLKVYSGGAVRIRSSYDPEGSQTTASQDVQIISADDLDFQASDKFWLTIGGTTKEVYFNGNYLGIRNA